MNLGLMKAFRITLEEVAAKYQNQRDEEELRERVPIHSNTFFRDASRSLFLDRAITCPTVMVEVGPRSNTTRLVLSPTSHRSHP